MYTRDFSGEPAEGGIPSGYGGNAFSPREETPPTDDTVPAGAHPHRQPPRHDMGSWLSHLSLSRLGDINLKSLFSGDLLLIAVALLLVMNNDDGCEDSDDLWILLLLLYFMK